MNNINESLAADRCTIQEYLLNFEQKMVIYANRKAEYMSQSRSTDEVKNKNQISNPVMWEAINSAEYDRNNPDYWWLRAVEVTEPTLNEIDRCILLYRRKAKKLQIIKRGKPAWIFSVQKELCYNFPRQWYSESYIKRHWKMIVDKALIIKYKITPKAREA